MGLVFCVMLAKMGKIRRNKVARVLITGAGRGLGLAFVRICLERGDRVWAGVRQPQKSPQLAELLEKYPQKLHLIPLDVTDNAAIESTWQQIHTEAGALDLLINNAGINSMSADAGGTAAHLRLGELDGHRMIGMFHVNAVAPLMLAQRCIDLLAAGDNPRIISISSWLGSLTNKTSGGNYSYCASKTALNMLMRALAFDVISKGIITVVFNPGWMQTDMGGPRAKLTPEESAQSILKVSEKLTPSDAGCFLNWDGTEHPW